MSGSSKASQFWDADAPFASASLVEMQKSPGLEGPLQSGAKHREAITGMDVDLSSVIIVTVGPFAGQN